MLRSFSRFEPSSEQDVYDKGVKGMKNNMMVVALVGCLVATFAPGQQKSSVASPETDLVRSEMLVSTKWLADHLKDPDVVILHICDGFSDYKRGHIPGARYLAMKKISVDIGPVSVELPSVQQLQQAFSELGVGDNTRVVIYTTGWFPYAARAWFTLDYLGHGDKATLLDGGIDQWLAEDRAVIGGNSPEAPAATFTPHVHDDYRALFDEVKADVDAKPGEEPEQIVDARPPRGYTNGHLAGATNIYWQETLVSEDDFQAPASA